MKIISWNLRNIGTKKLPKEFAATFSAFGLGGSCLDFITRFVTGNAAWQNLQSANPADVFVIIELKSGGKDQGNAGTSSCLVVLPRIVNAMNAVMNARGIAGNYTYASVAPRITGYHETVGIIYNTRALTFASSSVPPSSATNKGLTPRGPFYARFNLAAAPATSLYVAGIHAPPPKGSGQLRYSRPIDFNLQLTQTGIGNQGNTLIVGDFNCNPGSTYPGGGGPVSPFTTLVGFGSYIANGTLSSLRAAIAPANPPPGNYLSDAYDNVLFNLVPPGASRESVADMIGSARNMNAAGTPNVFATNPNDVFKAYRVLSDHLPVVMEY